MSTKPVAAKADTAITALSALSNDATKAVQAAKATVNNAEQTIDQVVHGAQVAVQHKKDEIEEAQHIIAQLSPRTATPPIEPPAPAADPTPAPAATEPPVAPATDPTPAPAATEPPVAPATEGTAQLGMGTAVEPPQRRRGNRVTFIAFFHGLGWGRVAWTIAMIFGSIALLWLLLGYDGFFPTRPEVLRVIGVIAITIFSWYVGGTIGSAFDIRRTRAVVMTEHEEAPPVPPVAS